MFLSYACQWFCPSLKSAAVLPTLYLNHFHWCEIDSTIDIQDVSGLKNNKAQEQQVEAASYSVWLGRGLGAFRTWPCR